MKLQKSNKVAIKCNSYRLTYLLTYLWTSRFSPLACRCLMEGKISRGTFAEYLEIDRAEIDDYLDAAGFVEGNYAKIAAA